jgi:hypothetical protein
MVLARLHTAKKLFLKVNGFKAEEMVMGSKPGRMVPGMRESG